MKSKRKIDRWHLWRIKSEPASSIARIEETGEIVEASFAEKRKTKKYSEDWVYLGRGFFVRWI